ncbi:MAG: response regulator [Candidatus Omnitrophica bacterium]|nr:response regulator [Candidatus Omnitrophota bacterium]
MSKKILIIDDEPELCESMCHCLREAGYKSYFALDGKAGLEMIERIIPHLVLLDIRMPGKDGIEVMREVVSRFPNLVIVVMTGFHDIEIAKRAIEYGACEYLTKPVALDTLISRYIKPILGE